MFETMKRQKMGILICSRNKCGLFNKHGSVSSVLGKAMYRAAENHLSVRLSEERWLKKSQITRFNLPVFRSVQPSSCLYYRRVLTATRPCPSREFGGPGGKLYGEAYRASSRGISVLKRFFRLLTASHSQPHPLLIFSREQRTMLSRTLYAITPQPKVTVKLTRK